MRFLSLRRLSLSRVTYYPRRYGSFTLEAQVFPAAAEIHLLTAEEYEQIPNRYDGGTVDLA